MTDRLNKGLSIAPFSVNLQAYAKYPPFINAWFASGRAIEKEMIRRGAVFGHGSIAEGVEVGESPVSMLGKPFTESERGNQVTYAIIKKMQLERDIKQLMKMQGENGSVHNVFKRLGWILGQSEKQVRNRLLMDMSNEQLADALAKGEMNDDLMSEVIHRTVRDLAFPITVSSKRNWWDNHPMVRVLAQFKVWPVEQLNFMYQDALKNSIKNRDPARLVRILVGLWFGGELYNIIRDFLTNRDESLYSTLKDPSQRNIWEVTKAIGNDMLDGGFIGMLADLNYGIVSWLAGPTGGTSGRMAESLIESILRPSQVKDASKKFLLKEVAPLNQAKGLLDRIDRKFFDDRNLTENFLKWRKHSWEYRNLKDFPMRPWPQVQKNFINMIAGFKKSFPTFDSLGLEIIGNNVLVGDIETAADYISFIINNTKPEDADGLVQKFTTSARNRSPYGNISQDEIPKFLAQFHPEKKYEPKFDKDGKLIPSSLSGEQLEAIVLQQKWYENYFNAVRLGGLQNRLEMSMEDKTEDVKEMTVQEKQDHIKLIKDEIMKVKDEITGRTEK
jgi:hypothetical protein